VGKGEREKGREGRRERRGRNRNRERGERGREDAKRVATRGQGFALFLLLLLLYAPTGFFRFHPHGFLLFALRGSRHLSPPPPPLLLLPLALLCSPGEVR
jgi:hypothetical protein